jgi:hypothetical protein
MRGLDPPAGPKPSSRRRPAHPSPSQESFEEDGWPGQARHDEAWKDNPVEPTAIKLTIATSGDASVAGKSMVGANDGADHGSDDAATSLAQNDEARRLTPAGFGWLVVMSKRASAADSGIPVRPWQSENRR